MRLSPAAFVPALVAALGCDIPLHALRSAPPPGIDAQALPVGAVAPGAGQPLPAVLVFYRGHW